MQLNFSRVFSFPRSAWERPQDKLSFFKKLSLLLKYGRGASGLHSHAERGNEFKCVTHILDRESRRDAKFCVSIPT